MPAVLYVAAKAPRPGFAKTRLGRAIGHDPAAALAGAFLRDLAARLARAPALPFEVAWFITPPDAWPEIAPLVGNLARARVVAQGEGDWGERQRALFRDAAARGERKPVLAVPLGGVRCDLLLGELADDLPEVLVVLAEFEGRHRFAPLRVIASSAVA